MTLTANRIALPCTRRVNIGFTISLVWNVEDMETMKAEVGVIARVAAPIHERRFGMTLIAECKIGGAVRLVARFEHTIAQVVHQVAAILARVRREARARRRSRQPVIAVTVQTAHDSSVRERPHFVRRRAG